VTDPFPVALAPHVLHPRVVRLGGEVRADLLARALRRYLSGTVALETRIVGPVAATLDHADARELCSDEDRHAQMAADLLARLGYELDTDPPAFERRLLAIEAAFPADPIRFLFTVVTETVISSTLATVPRDPAVAAPVRDFVGQHARDEAWHAAFFGKLFAEFWGRASEADRARITARLPGLIHAYLAPDVDGIAADLRAVGVDDADDVVAETYSPERVSGLVREGARPTLALLARCGLDPVL
jgi:hypothetical protein